MESCCRRTAERLSSRAYKFYACCFSGILPPGDETQYSSLILNQSINRQGRIMTEKLRRAAALKFDPDKDNAPVTAADKGKLAEAVIQLAGAYAAA